jgi:hypothetical protein
MPDTNSAAADSLGAIVGQEMIHLCLACNILNALGGSPDLTHPPAYPGNLPGDIGPPGGDPIVAHLYCFSADAMAQGMAIEQPEKPILRAALAADQTETIGQFYARLDAFLATLDPGKWIEGRNQIDDSQYFPGQLYPVNNYADAHRAIGQIVSEGEGSQETPLDFQHEVSHYYRFGEMFHNGVLTRIPEPPGYRWGPAEFGIDFDAAYPAITDPALHPFSKEPPAAQAAQAACDRAYSGLIDALQLAVTGQPAQMGAAIRAMFDLRKAAMVALTTKLNDGKVAGPAFRYTPTRPGAPS